MRLPADEARRRFADAPVARLATVRPDGTPHLVPVFFAAVLTADGDRILLAVDPKPKATLQLARLANIRANPSVSLLVDHYEADWRQLWWVRADGLARVVESGPEREAVIERLIARYPQYTTLPGEFGDAVIVRVSAWSSWTAT
jgi:PPOX class probable F420-dependent enzyme